MLMLGAIKVLTMAHSRIDPYGPLGLLKFIMICLLLAQQLFQGALKGSSVPRMLLQQGILMLILLEMFQARMAMTCHLFVMLKHSLLLPGTMQRLLKLMSPNPMMLSQLIFFAPNC